MRLVRRTALAVAAVLAATCLSPGLATSANASSCPVVTADGEVVPFASYGVQWSGCNLAGAHLDGASLTSASLSGADLRGATLRGATLRGATLLYAKLDGADLSAADLSRADLYGATLAGTVTVGTIFAGATLLGANVQGATLADADLRGLLGTGVSGVPTALPAGWGVHSGWLVGPGVDLSYLQLWDVDLHGADLTDANLDGTYLSRVDLSGAVLTRTALHGTSLVVNNLTGAIGVTTARVSATTTWEGSTCPDAYVADLHNGRSCQLALDTIAPVISVTAPRYSFREVSPMTVGVTEKGSGIEGYRQRIITAPTATSAYGRQEVTGWYDQDPRPYTGITYSGQRTCVSLQVRDWAGHVSAWSRYSCTDGVIDDTGGELSSSGNWYFRGLSNYIQGSSQNTYHHGAFLEKPHVYPVRTLGVVALTCPTCGSIALYISGHKVGAFSLVSTTTKRKALVLARWTTAHKGIVRVVVTSPTGRLVRLDALVVSTL